MFNFHVKKLVYSGDQRREISMPIGGIGTGCIGLAGNGSLVDFEIFNKPNKRSANGFTFFAVKAEKDGKIVDIRALQNDSAVSYSGSDRYHPDTHYWAGFGLGADRDSMFGFPHFPASDFISSYPFGEIDLSYEKFPGKIHMTVFNPLIPLNDTDSSIPAAFFEYEVTNDTDSDIDYTFYGVLENPFEYSVNLYDKGRDENVHHITCATLDKRLLQHEQGEMCIGVSGDDVKYQQALFRGKWYDNIQSFWNDINAGALRNRFYEPAEGRKDPCVLSTHIKLAPGEKKPVRFVISWYMPYRCNDWSPIKPKDSEINPQLYSEEEIKKTKFRYYQKNLWKNYYTRYFDSAADCVNYCFAHWDRLCYETDTFRELLFSSTLPKEVIDAVSANISILRSPTCMRNEDGSFYAFEGNGRSRGLCEGTCTHVWNYAYALPYLYPNLERSIRTNHYKYDMDFCGGLAFRTLVPLGRSRFNDATGDGSVTEKAFACADGQFGDVLKVYREFKMCGDKEWLAGIWKDVVKSIEYAWNPENPFKWDPEKTGHLYGRQHHTLDMELFSPNSWLDGFYVAALKAAAELAVIMKDKKHAALFSELYEKGREYLNTELYNGRYFIQKVDVKDRSILYPFVKTEDKDDMQDEVNMSYWNEETQEVKYQIGEGSSVDQVLAQWHCDIIGLGDVFDREKTLSALRTIYEENFRSMRDFFNPCRLFAIDDEKGVTICCYPEGAKKPKIPVPYAEECMNGFEYQAASHMIMNGMYDEGLEIVKAIRQRYDGTRRNPWNEMECGSNYTRSMASYALLGAYCGLRIDAYNKAYRFCPDMRFAEKGVFRCFVCFEGFMGYVERGIDYIQFKCVKGSIFVRSVEVPEKPLKVKAADHEIGFTAYGNNAVFDNETEINPKRSLLIIIRQ